MKKEFVVLVLAVAISLVLSACGGATASPTKNINVALTDFQFAPNHFTVPAGEEIHLKATNEGAVIHNFVIMKLGQSAGTEFNEEDLPNIYWKIEIDPGGSVDTTFTAPSEPGDYEVVCSTPGHVQAGMVAKLTVVASASNESVEHKFVGYSPGSHSLS